MPAHDPKLSVVIPVYNEEQVLPTLFTRLYPALVHAAGEVGTPQIRHHAPPSKSTTPSP